MKKLSRFARHVAIFGLLMSTSLLTAYAVFADETVSAPHEAVSAPQVVAPAQPAGSNTVGAVNGAPANAATTGGSIAGAVSNAILGTPNTATANAAPPQTAGGMFQMALPLIIMLGVMYFIAIRPQQKKAKEHQTLLTALKAGDEVITSSGILGTITGMSEKVVNLEISKNVQIKILKSQVNQVVKGPIQDIVQA